MKREDNPDKSVVEPREKSIQLAELNKVDQSEGFRMAFIYKSDNVTLCVIDNITI